MSFITSNVFINRFNVVDFLHHDQTEQILLKSLSEKSMAKTKIISVKLSHLFYLFFLFVIVVVFVLIVLDFIDFANKFIVIHSEIWGINARKDE